MLNDLIFCAVLLHSSFIHSKAEVMPAEVEEFLCSYNIDMVGSRHYAIQYLYSCLVLSVDIILYMAIVS